MLRDLARAAGKVQRRFREVHGAYLASAVALRAFISLFPLLLVAIAVVGFFSAHSHNLAGSIIGQLGLRGEAATALNTAVANAEHSRRAASIVGIAGLLWSGLGLVTALEFAFDAVWQTSGRGWHDKLVALAWLAGAGLILIASVAATAALGFLPAIFAPLGIALTLVVDTALWLWSLKVLPSTDVAWRALLPGAVVGAVGFQLLKVIGGIGVPRAVASSSALYGTVGVVFAILAWLLLFGRLVVYAAVVNVVQWEQKYGTVTAEIELPRIPGETPVGTTRAGEAIT